MPENDSVSILVIEDDRDTNDLISEILSEAGYEAISAFDGESGLERARKEIPDVILLDLMLPTIDGIKVCRMLSASDETKSIPVIVLTAKQELSTKLSSFVAGARRFLTKPFDDKELLGEIERTLRQKRMHRRPDDDIIEPRD